MDIALTNDLKKANYSAWELDLEALTSPVDFIYE